MIYSSRDLTDPASSKTRNTGRTSNWACNLLETKYRWNVYSCTIPKSKPAVSTPDKLNPHTASATNRQLWLRQTLSALNATNSETETPENTNITQSKSLPLPKSLYIISLTQPIPLYERALLLLLQPHRLELFVHHGRRVMEHARHRFPGAVRLHQSFPGHLHNALVAACRPLER